MMNVIFTLFAFFLSASGDVTMAGYDLYNTRDFSSNINKENIDELYMSLNLSMSGPATSTPSVVDGRFTVSDYGGIVNSWNDNGTLKWSTNITTECNFVFGVSARGTPTFVEDENIVVLGTTVNKNLLSSGYGAWLFALNFTDGTFVYKTLVDSHPWAIITQSITVKGNKLYFGTSSSESSGTAPVNPGYNCCSFVGAAYAYRATNGQLLWKTPMIPTDLATLGYAGAAIWGGAIVVAGNDLYFGTGQFYHVPDDIATCINANPLNTSCIDKRALFDATVRLNRHSGEILSAFNGINSDVWNLACYFGGYFVGCQTLAAAKDFDTTSVMYSKQTNTLYSQSKSGIVFSFQADLTLRWMDVVVPGVTGGGYIWFSALRDAKYVEDIRAYFPNNNNGGLQFQLLNGTNTTAGAWVCYDGLGNVKWITPGINGAKVYGGVALTNNILFGSTLDGMAVALDAETGTILWTFNLGTLMTSGPAIVGNNVYWPTGQQGFGDQVAIPRRMYVFSIA